MHDKGTHLFPAMERVDFGRPAAQALAAEADRLGQQACFPYREPQPEHEY
ncbi:hypothetical protein ACHMW6_27085 [Pseudoduganella sp. UC29_106]